MDGGHSAGGMLDSSGQDGGDSCKVTTDHGAFIDRKMVEILTNNHVY